ncbi:HCO3- transporter family protein [Glarea lozoyensis ATCC 20868]|uniref:HCO3-transporter family protein n=1 Tax=Glarea lozoyensis (strain ATCC 20868 / MF5171) TaxID=1116229 RepID=S3CXP1_GLAL2|nr:HCO3- transporter family protein [Glarea lozoyensis ATCC 20868]EPE24606.1 HCO3- transporter family protein [Glarea lozoyensis ATCC 20868]
MEIKDSSSSAPNDSSTGTEPDIPSNTETRSSQLHPKESPPPRPAPGYTFDGQTGWEKFRLLRPGWGMYHDVRRRLPFYRSDITDAFTYRTIASTIRPNLYKSLLPALAYTLDMDRRPNGFYGVNESLFSSALAAMVFSTISAQPLTIVGITGLISLFNYTIYDIIEIYDVTLYPRFMCWTAIWAAIFHWVVAFGNLCDYMRYVTDFSSEVFGMYVGIIYMIKGVEELVSLFDSYGVVDGYLSCVIAILYFATVYALEKLGNGVLAKPWARGLLADYAYPIATLFWVGFSHIPGTLKRSNISTLPITRAFYPTQQRSWLIEFWTLDVKWIFVAMPFGFLVMLLFYYDHNVSCLTAQAKQYPLKKPGGFHWDFFLLGCTTFIAGILGIPLPNGLVPQAPVHTDSLTVYETELRVIATEEGEGNEIRRPIVKASKVVEQRVSHFLMGLGIIGTMTGPLLIVLHTMPRAIFSGVFFVVGWGSIESNGITKKLLFLLSERRFIQSNDPLLQIPRSKIWLYLFCQMIGVALPVAISQTIAAIGFPVLVCILIPFRWVLMPKFFSLKELQVMDDLTATNEVVLASLGGAPKIADTSSTEGFGLEREFSERRSGVPRQRVGSFHR